MNGTDRQRPNRKSRRQRLLNNAVGNCGLIRLDNRQRIHEFCNIHIHWDSPEFLVNE